MKKGIIFLVLAIFIAGGVFAQEIKNWISGEASFFGVGARYERMLNKNFSVGGMAFYNSLILWNAYGASAVARYYPWTNGFYVGCDLGYGMIQGWEKIGGYSWVYVVSGVMVTPEVGWKIDFGDPGGFFISPMITLPIVFGKKTYDARSSSEFKVGTHFRAAVALGGSF